MKGGQEPGIPGPLGRRPRRLRALWLRHLSPPLALAGMATGRALDLLLAFLSLLLLSPLLLIRGLWARISTGQVFRRERRIGRFRVPFERLYFAGAGPGQGLPVLLNILRGDMALAGPRPLRPDEAAGLDLDAAVRFTVRPGVFSPYALRSRTGIAYDPEARIDRDYAYGQSLRGDAGLTLRSLVAAGLGGRATAPTPPELNFFGVPIVNTTLPEAVDWITARVRSGGPPALLAFVNPDCLNIAYRNHDYHQILVRATRVLPDGIGIHIGCRMLGVALKANVNGTDLFPALCARAEELGLSLYLLGGQPGIAQAVATNMTARFPGLRIAGTRHGYFDAAEEDSALTEINDSGADILLVAFGVPRQEQWLQRHHDRLRPVVRMGVGGLFDFYSGRIPRAPQWMREIGLEWTWRLLQEPGRLWRRYLIGNPLFLYRVWRQARGVEKP